MTDAGLDYAKWKDHPNWHKVFKTDNALMVISESFGHIIERRDYILFEDERDAITYRLRVS